MNGPATHNPPDAHTVLDPRLTWRDAEVLRQTALHDVLTSQQITDLVTVIFPGSSRAHLSRRLQFLSQDARPQYLRRLGRQALFSSLPSYCYELAPAGEAVLSQLYGWTPHQPEWHGRRRPFEHTLLTNALRVPVEIAARASRGFRLIEPADILASAPDLIRPAGAALDLGGRIPDWSFGLHHLERPAERAREHFFYEADCGGMRLRLGPRADPQNNIRDKFQGYAALWDTLPFPFRVLTVTTCPERITNMIGVLDELGAPKGGYLLPTLGP
jgi:Replication-relaxation